jgi:hypothetical protein
VPLETIAGEGAVEQGHDTSIITGAQRSDTGLDSRKDPLQFCCETRSHLGSEWVAMVSVITIRPMMDAMAKQAPAILRVVVLTIVMN